MTRASDRIGSGQRRQLRVKCMDEAEVELGNGKHLSDFR